ncbi:AAA ATPase-like protein [Barrientosiimonas humi]|uniref:AAA ATPase-like protein n=1 Tax=Barrientosiimonas humi TaxID=999931 RepID=A0A542XGF2_9MICO|nr:LuxR family transcriptional regulator [Barrientosiimonas humi]TQL34904.1 AAA ATPase-like protein [Barrientosiimonas humi]
MTARDPVGRDAEVAQLVELVRLPRDRGMSVALVTGPPRVGRSTVLDAVAAQHDGPVLRAHGLPWESARPGAVLDQLVGSVGLDLDTDADPIAAATRLRDALVAGDAAGAPGRGPSPADDADAAAGEDAAVLVVVDDLHRADAESLQALASLRRHHPDAAVRLLLSIPTGGASHTESAAASGLLADLADLRIELGPLDADAVAALAARRGIALAPWAVERLRAHTGGRPGPIAALLAESEPATWAEPAGELPAPAGTTADVRRRLGDLAPPARRLVEAAGVLQPDGGLALTGELAQVDDVWSAVDAAVASGLLRVAGPPGAPRVRLSDPMVAAAVRAQVGTAGVRALHLRAAELVADPADALTHRVAAAAGPDDTLAHELDDAAETFAAQGAWGRTAALLADASRLSSGRRERESRLTRAVDALVGAGDVHAALALLPEVESLRETPLRDAVLGYLAILRGRGVDAHAQLDRAWAIVNADREPATAALISQRFVLDALCRGAWTELVTWADRAVALGGAESAEGVESAAIRGLGLVAGGEIAEARRAYAGLRETVRHGAQAQRVLLGTGWLLLATDEVAAARAALERAVPLSHHGGSTRISLWARAWLARAQFRSGDWDEAVRTATEGLDLVDASGIVLTRPLLGWTLVQVHTLRGDDEAALHALRGTESAPQDYATMRVPTLLARAALAEARSDHEGVVAALTPLTDPLLAEAVSEPGYWPWVEPLVSALVGLGRLAEASDLLTATEERVGARGGPPSAVARLARARGRLEAARGNGNLAAAREAFETALEQLAGTPLRVERAHTLFAFGQVLRRAGKRGDADPLLTAARDGYAAIGARACVERCERELRAGGVRGRSGPEGARAERAPTDLTPQERAVADLVAQGRSNREAADVLFLSTKTVQYHLTRIYAKLGVRSRTELAAQWDPTTEHP